MPSLDISTLINWLVSGFIGLIFGVGGAWVAHRYQRQRDDIAWKREKEKLRKQFEHDKKMLQLGFEQKLREVEQQRIRENLLRGVESPDRTIEELQRAKQRIHTPSMLPPAPKRAPADTEYSSSTVVAVILTLLGILIAILIGILQR
jgi:hypothetical protein